MQKYIDRLRTLIDEQLMTRYQALPAREQRMVLLLGLFLALTLPIFGLILPLEDSRSALAEDVRALKMQALEAEQLAEQLKLHGSIAVSGNVMSEVDQIARSSGVREFMTRIKPQASVKGRSALVVQMKDVPYKRVVQFFTALNQKGLSISSAKMQESDKPGHVHLQATIDGGA